MFAPPGWKQPDWVAMSGPILTQHLQCTHRERDVAVSDSLAAMNMNDHPLAGDIADFQVQAFLETQSERVDRPEVGFVVRGVHGVDETSHFGDAQDVRQGFGSKKVDFLERRPVAGTVWV